MLIKSVYLKEGFYERAISFDPSVTMIHSSTNSCGKTTLLRFLLYGLGYNIPNTRKIKFNKCEIRVEIRCEALGDITLIRNNSAFIVMKVESVEHTYVLPEQEHELHAKLFGTQNIDILENLLGAFYVDQEKGWTLLNRGTVIGSIHFNIEALVRGLSNRDCSSLIKKVAKLQREREKYKQMSSVAQYRESLQVESGTVATDTYEETSNAELSRLLTQQQQLKRELQRIDKTLSDNNRFKKYVAEMKLLVRSPDGSVFPVTANNIVGLTDAIDLLVTKRKIVSREYAIASSKVEALEKEQDCEFEQLAFFQTASQIEIFDKKILRMPLNPQAIEKELSRIDKEIKETQDQISELTRADNSVVKSLSENIISFGTELGIGTAETIPANYLFTSNLKELSGALLHKTAFAFRLAYITAIEDALKIRLPIILDSPSGKEVDLNNVALMMNILKRDFSKNQIIIASIYKYDFNNATTVEIAERLINQEIRM